MDRSQELTQALRRLLRRKQPPRSPSVQVAPCCAFAAVLDERIKHLEEQVQELKGRANGIVWAVLGAVVLELVARLAFR